MDKTNRMTTTWVLLVGICLWLMSFTLSAEAAGLTWDDYADKANITGFVIYSQEVGTTDMKSVQINDPAATEYPLNPIYYKPGGTYRFWISAYNDLAESTHAQANRDWTAPEFVPPDNPPDVVINIPGTVNNVQVNVGNQPPAQ